MGISKDIETIRELTKKYMEIAMSEKHIRMRQRFKDTNDLKVVRPPLIIEELPWGQLNIDGELNCVCEDNGLRGMEYGLRMALLREKYFACDNYIEPAWVVYKSYSNTGNGMRGEEDAINDPSKNSPVYSHAYHDVLKDESALENFHNPVVTAHPENDERNLAYVREIVGDTIPVVLRGHGIYYAPWDQIATLRGVTPILIDVYDRPEYLHKIIARFTEGMKVEMDQMEELGLYDPNAMALHSTPNAVTIPNPSTDGHYRCRDIWFRTMAQMFSSISPEAHYEFDMQYSIPLAERCAYTYYGCCEALHDRFEQVTRYKNLRKIGCSPICNVEMLGEKIGGNYVLSRKPNPANVAIKTDPEEIRKEITETVKVCLKYGCPCDITLKDISTIGNRPENIIVWAKTASAVLDEYYGEA